MNYLEMINAGPHEGRLIHALLHTSHLIHALLALAGPSATSESAVQAITPDNEAEALFENEAVSALPCIDAMLSAPTEKSGRLLVVGCEVPDQKAPQPTSTTARPFPQEGLVSLKSILAPTGPLEVSASSWWKGVAEGRYPKPVKLGPRTTRWRAEEIRSLFSAAFEGSN